MKIYLLALCILGCWLTACDSQSTSSSPAVEETLPPREATDPVPEPPSQPDTGATATSTPIKSDAAGATEVYYRLHGTEPFWSLTLAQPYSTYRTMEGDSLSFAFKAPQAASGRTAEWAQLFPLADKGWVLLRKGNTPCSDGMSDLDYAYTATVWLEGQLLDGCGKKE